MAMIKIFDATDRDFSSAGNIIIDPLYCHEIHKKSLNGWYIDVEIPIKFKQYITKDKLCVVKTKSKLNPQAFRISEDIKYSTNKITFKAEHVMFDSKKYTLLDVRPTNLNGLNGLKYINERTDTNSPFNIINSNVENKNTSYFIRKTLFEAWTIFEEKWNGVFDADNWNISFKQKVGQDNGETIAYGKNMQGFEIFEDWSNVCTKVLAVGHDGLLLPEPYLKSKIQYEVPYTRIVEFQTELEKEEQTEEKLLEELRTKATAYLEQNSTPQVSYTVNSNINNSLEIGDTIKVLHPFVNIFTEVLEYEYDLISEKIVSLTFGNYSRDAKTKFNNIKNTLEKIRQEVSNQDITIKGQTELINSLNKNGYVYIDENEILILDKLPKENSKNVWRFGLAGIGFSSNGYEGPFETAITMDGKINADFITTGTMATDRIEGLSNFISEYESQIASIMFNLDSIQQKVDKTITYKRENSNITELLLENARESDLLKLEIQGNKTYEANLFPRTNLYPRAGLQVNQKGG
ncbi:phage tail spike protein [Methanobrevibacter smithii]|uniref:phage tail spike protein n=1 Tax=Methanobrevibacter smithii TaxID=2173 RepID=UPI0037DC3401